ncbi:MAG: amidophosphoribosyltransferase [Anaerovoracaceae bacterium]|jgi:amidophosphoribosyltransferase
MENNEWVRELLDDDKFHDECGVIGIMSPGQKNVAKDIYFGLHSLQHRGQESAGIASNMYGNINCYKEMGLVQEVFDDDIMSKLPGDIGIGHVRYSTAGGSRVINAQPIVVYSKYGSLAIAHNGNLVNAVAMRNQMEDQGYIFQTDIDTEVIAALIARNLRNGTLEEAVSKTCLMAQGGFALVMTMGSKLIGVRDPHGIRPLCIGKTENGYILSSESCVFALQGAEFVRDVKPGEMVVFEDGEMKSIMYGSAECRMCSFEYVYFARTDSFIDGIGVYQSRRKAGRILARADKDDTDADLVIAVPDSGTVAAIGYAEESGIPFGEGFIKNRYVGRTFIQPTQEMRELSVMMKLNVLKGNIEGKRIVMIDDSIVRGTTSVKIVKMLRKAGVKEIHMRISSPPVAYPCYMGIDTPDRDKLMAANKTVEEMRKHIGVDSLKFLPVDGLKKCIGLGDNICTACFTGEYPVELIDQNYDTNKLYNDDRMVGEYDDLHPEQNADGLNPIQRNRN